MCDNTYGTDGILESEINGTITVSQLEEYILNYFDADKINQKPETVSDLLRYYKDTTDYLYQYLRCVSDKELIFASNELRAALGHIAEYRINNDGTKNDLEKAYGHFRRMTLDILKVICDVFDEVLSIVNEYNIAHHLLTVEITESAFIKNQQFLANQINRFREAGFNVWMDDFGSEYSSLNTLQEYSFDLIKLDMRFMKNFSLTGKNRLILSDVLTMISKLGVSTLAEGVQTKEQLRFLRDAGCDKVQGFLLGKPMPCEHFYQERIYNGLQYDDFNKTSYYDKICTIHLDPHLLMSDLGGFFGDTSITPMAVLEFSNSSFRILKANGAYKSFLEEIGQDKELIYNDYYEWYRTPAPEFIDSVKKCLSSRKNESIVNVVENGLRISANISFIAYDAKTDTGAVLTIITKLDSPLPSDVSESTEAPKAEDTEESETEELKPADADEITSDETEADEEGSAAE